MNSSIARALSVALVIGLVSTNTVAWAQLPAVTPEGVQKRQKELTVRIDDAELAGRLSDSEADNFRDSLKRIAEAEERYKNDGLISNWESVVLSFQIDALSSKLEKQMGQRKSASSNIDGRQVDLNQRIDDAQNAKQISDEEAMAFKEDLDKIATKEAKFRASEGNVSEGEKLELSVDLDLLSKTIEEKLDGRLVNLPDIDKSKKDLQARLTSAKSGSKITAQEYDRLNGELVRIFKLEKELRASEGRLTIEEGSILALQFEQINNNLDALIKGK